MVNYTTSVTLGVQYMENESLLSSRAVKTNRRIHTAFFSLLRQKEFGKITVSDIALPKGVEFADKELDMNTAIAILTDPAAEAAAREAEDAAAKEAGEVDAADVPSDNGAKPEEKSSEKAE
jgi:hypothetical protein